MRNGPLTKKAQSHPVKESEEHAASSQKSQATAKLQQKTQNPKEETQ